MNLALLEAELRLDEGVRFYRYLDSRGIATTAVGHNLQASPLPRDWAYPLTPAQVEQLLTKDIADTFTFLDLNLPWWRSLDEVRQRVVANMAFNLRSKLLGFVKALAAMKAHDYATAGAEMRSSAWFGQVGARAVRLCSAMETGVMPS